VNQAWCRYSQLFVSLASGFQANFVCVDGQHDKDDFKITGFGSN